MRPSAAASRPSSSIQRNLPGRRHGDAGAGARGPHPGRGDRRAAARGGQLPGAEGHFFRIVSIEGPQVGDLNLWNAGDLSERFFSGKTRALHATHLTTGDRLWSNLPHLRPMATITHDTLGWYGFDEDGAGVHDVIGTRCDPYTHRLLSGGDYHYCCHSNLSRALGTALGQPARAVEHHVHDVFNVFMCTGFTRTRISTS